MEIYGKDDMAVIFSKKCGDRLWGAVIGWVGHIGFLGIAGIVRFKPYSWATPEASIYATGWTEDFQAPWWTSMFNAILDELQLDIIG